jgi:NTE family protein
MSRVLSKYLLLLIGMHDILPNIDLNKEIRSRFMRIGPLYHKIADQRGAMIEDITKIERSEDTHSIFEDLDFSVARIRKLIRQGEEDVDKAIENKSKQLMQE